MQWIQAPRNSYYYIYYTASQFLSSNMTFGTAGVPVLFLYAVNPLDRRVGVLVNPISHTVFAYTVPPVGTPQTVTTFAMPLATPNSTLQTRVMLVLDANGLSNGKFRLLSSSGVFSDTEVTGEGNLRLVSSGSNFLFSAFTLPHTDFKANLWSCAQFDPETNGPIFKQGLGCLGLGKEAKLLDAYCSKWPISSTGEVCSQACKDPKTVCHQGMKQLCQGENLLTSECRNFCALPGVNCDQAASTFCSSVTPETLLTSEALQKTCGCFMPQKFYDTFFGSFSSKVDTTHSPLNLPPIAPCFFPYCSREGSLKPYYIKTSDYQCPTIQTCINQVNFNNQGEIVGDITIASGNECDFRPK
jgi:hypothetical protein